MCSINDQKIIILAHSVYKGCQCKIYHETQHLSDFSRRDAVAFQVRFQLYEHFVTPGFHCSIANFTSFHTRCFDFCQLNWKARQNFKNCAKTASHFAVLCVFFEKKNGPDIGTIRSYDIELRTVGKQMKPFKFEVSHRIVQR